MVKAKQSIFEKELAYLFLGLSVSIPDVERILRSEFKRLRKFSGSVDSVLEHNGSSLTFCNSRNIRFSEMALGLYEL